MNKFLFLIIFIITSLFFLSRSVYSQTTTNVLIPGQSCGNPIAVNQDSRKCCFYQPTRVSIKPVGIGIVDGLLSSLSKFLDEQVLGPALNPLNELVQKTVRPCLDGQPSTPGNPSDPNCTCVVPIVSPLSNIKPLCANIDQSKNSVEYNNCLNCLSGQSGTVGIWTGIGCIYVDTKSFIQETVLKLGVGLAGGFSLLCIIYAAFMMQSSQGNPEKLKKAQEMITSCIMGLMLIIFSVLILRLIGVNILRIPGFS